MVEMAQLDRKQDVLVGHYMEDVCCPRLNTGLFSALTESGNVQLVVFGHGISMRECQLSHMQTIGMTLQACTTTLH